VTTVLVGMRTADYVADALGALRVGPVQDALGALSRAKGIDFD